MKNNCKDCGNFGKIKKSWIHGGLFVFALGSERLGETVGDKDKTSKPMGIPIEWPPKPENPKPDETKDKQKDVPPIPERPKDALTGSAFGEHLKSVEKKTREELKAQGKTPNQIEEEVRRTTEKEIYDQLRSGNMPQHLRQLKEVPVEMKDENGEKITGTIKVMPDYISIGSDKDAIRVPMTPATAQLLARQWGMSLPTTTMVDAIAAEARRNGITIPPRPKPAGTGMDSTQYFLDHNATIEEQLVGKNLSENPLIDGDKKDVILPYEHEGKRGYVTIYGWHGTGDKYKDGWGKPLIQPYSGAHHEATYRDYSHGIRLIAGEMTIRYKDGKTETKKVSDVLNDKKLYRLVSAVRIDDPDYSYPDDRWSKTFDRGTSIPTRMATATDKETPSDRSSFTNSTPPSSSAESPLPTSLPAATTSPASTPSSSPSSASASIPNQPPSPAPLSPSAPSLAPSPSVRNQSSSPSYSPPPSASSDSAPSPPSDSSIATANKSAEQKEHNESEPIQGSILFLGDSMTENMSLLKEIKTTGQKSEIAKIGQNSSWLLRELNSQSPEKIKKFDHAVVLIGTNDISGMDAPGQDMWSAKAIFERINSIWEKLKEINPNIKIYACTIPPFRGYKYSTYGSNFTAVNKKRIDINNAIRSSKMPFKVIDLCKTVDNGGLADNSDESQAALADTVKPKGEYAHPNLKVLADIYRRELT